MFRKVAFKIDHFSIYHNGIFMILPACMCVCARALGVNGEEGGGWRGMSECYTGSFTMCDDA